MNTMNSSIEKKFGIHYFNGIHTYKLDLNIKNYHLDSYSPYIFIIDGKKIEEVSWGRLLERLANYLINKYQASKNDLLEHRVSFSKAPIFLLEGSLASHYELENGLFLNCNRTSTHLCMSVTELLVFFAIRPSDCELYVRKPAGLEDEEVQVYYYERIKLAFIEYLSVTHRFEEAKIEAVLSAISKMDILLKIHFPNQLSFLSFDDKKDYSSFKSRFKFKIYPTLTQQEHAKSMTLVLELITKFHTYMSNMEHLSHAR